MIRLREEIQRRQDEPKMGDPLFMVPFSRDPSFVGREDILVKLSERAVASPAHVRTALVGLGGVG